MNPLSNKPASVLLLDIATAIGLASALVYVMGWTYAYHYFGNFGLGLLMLEIPMRYYLMYGFWVFKDWWLVLVLIYILIVLPYPYSEPYAWSLARRYREERPLLLKHLQVLAVMAAFLLGWWLATMSADRYYREQQTEQFPNYPHVKVWLKKATPQDRELNALYEALPKGGYRLLLQNQGKLFLFKPPSDGRPGSLVITELAMSEVKTLKVVP